MSEERATEQLVTRLASGLAPVQPIAPLHWQVLAVFAAWGAAAVLALLWLGGLHPAEALARGAVSASFVWLLGLLAPAGLVLGLASRIPGREPAAWTAAGIAGGAALALAGVIAALGGGAFSTPFEQCDGCFVKVLILAVPALVVGGWFARRGAPWRPALAGVSVALGAAAAGGLIVHLWCPSTDPSHWIQGHVVAPLATAIAVGLVVAYTGLMPRFFAGSGSSGRAR